MVKELVLSKGHITIVDDEDYEWLSQWKWTAKKGSGRYAKVYAYRNQKANGTQTHIALHRLIADCPKGLVVDHINGDTLDNRRSNLRICTQKDNARNSSAPINSPTGFKGAVLRPCGKRWQSRIRVDGRMLHLGMFSTLAEALLAYDAAAIHYFGEFANLNFPDEVALKYGRP